MYRFVACWKWPEVICARSRVHKERKVCKNPQSRFQLGTNVFRYLEIHFCHTRLHRKLSHSPCLGIYKNLPCENLSKMPETSDNLINWQKSQKISFKENFFVPLPFHRFLSFLSKDWVNIFSILFAFVICKLNALKFGGRIVEFFTDFQLKRLVDYEFSSWFVQYLPKNKL